MSNKIDKRKELNAGVISSYAYIRGHNNYGSLLQYYALQQYLKKFNIEAYWIRYMFPAREMYLTLLKKFIRSILHITSIRNLFNHMITQWRFRNFIHTHCNLSYRKYNSIEKLKKNIPIADIYITGSDQVWGGCLEPNYLTFAPIGKKKIAYAVSFGKKEISLEHREHITSWVKTFNAVSVRECSGIEICNKMGVNATHVLDPTLLIDDDEYLPSNIKRIEKKKYIFCYFINEKSPNNLRIDDIISFSKVKSIKLKITGIEGPETIIPGKYIYQYSPSGWLNHYKYADYIFTNTFHGTVFCIIFKRPFCVLLQKGTNAKQNERIYSLLEMLGLQDRILGSEEPIDNIMNKSINWEHVESEINKQRIKANQFWIKSLEELL